MTWDSATPMHVEVGCLYKVNHQWNLQQHLAIPHWSGALWDSAAHGILLRDTMRYCLPMCTVMGRMGHLCPGKTWV